MKKQFYKVKHFADQTFSRAGKTEVLTDDLQSANKHVEHINNIVAGLNKRFGNPPNINDPAVKEKRIKKCPEFLLGNTMLENVIDDGKGLISYTLNECGKAEIALANEIIDHESKIEQLVSLPIHQLLETDIPNIHKLKKELRMLIGNVENLKSRYHQASKHGTTGTNSTKAGNIKDELDSAESKVELCQDHLAAEMFQLMSKEAVLAQTIFQYVKLQRAYHESALHCLKDVIPQLERYINDNQMKPVYGCPLEKHLQLTNRKIALPIQICVSALLRVGMDEQGLFRIASGAAKLRRIKMSFDAWCISFPIALEYDPHTLAGALKSYLRELPEPILTYRLYSEWMSIAKVSQISERQRLINELLQKLPASNFDNLKFLIKFLAILSKNENNKMTCQNLGIIIAPNLLWSPQEDTTSIVMDTANNSSLIVEQLITNANYYFPGDIDFDEDLETGIVNGSETSSGGLRRCVSSSSLSDPAESPSQGSPKPATRRKNKPAPTPPSGNTPDKHDKRPDDKPPPAPDKPPRPLSTATLNRSSYKAAKNNKSQDLSNINPERKHLNKSFDNLSTENETQPSNFFLLKEESSNNIVQKNVNESSNEDLLNTKIENEKEKVTEDIKLNPFIGFEGYSAKLPNKPNESENLNNASQTPNKLVPNEKSSPIILERRKVPIATPRNLSNLASNIHGDETVELRRKMDSNSSVNVDRSSKPAIPERPAGLMRPSSLIRPQPRSTNENLVSDSGVGNKTSFR